MGKLVASRPNLAILLASANRLARGEILVALREPQRQLLGVIKARAADMKEMAAIEEFAEEVSATEWGSW